LLIENLKLTTQASSGGQCVINMYNSAHNNTEYPFL